MATVVILSNGHGEDAVGALLAREMLNLCPELAVKAFPLVGAGLAYQRLGLPVLGPRRQLPSGGLMLHSSSLLWQDLCAGFLSMTFSQLGDLHRLRAEVLVVVGDIYAQLLSLPARAEVRFVVQTLVSAWHTQDRHRTLPNRYFMETISLPERLLMRHLARRVYVRDRETECLLRSRGVSRVSALGNPMLDGLAAAPLAELAGQGRVIALLPGTRAYAGTALQMMLAALECLPGTTGVVAWAGGDLPEVRGWHAEELAAATTGHLMTLRRGRSVVHVYERCFAEVLRSSCLALATAGTANEQAAALGLPVVSFPLPPFYSQAFLDNQGRLLGEALIVVRPQPAAVAAALQRLLEDPARRRRIAGVGPLRLGAPGGSRAIAADLLRRAGLL